MTNKLKAPSVLYAQSVYRKDDPKELFISINEFAYHISVDSKNALQACYWLEWIMEFQKICANKKEKCLCERRSNMPVEDKFQMVDKNPTEHWYDGVGHLKHEERIKEGLDLFGKYYRSLWD
jgi:hypothetical protein